MEFNIMIDVSMTYGEIIPGQLKNLFSKHTKLSTFIDLGSGKGKLCLEACSLPSIQSVIGLELLPARLAQALKLKKQYNREMSHCQFYLHDLNIPFSDHKTPALAYLCATCFTESLLINLARWLTNDAFIQCIISLKPLPLNASIWRVTKIGMLLCSWDVAIYYQYTKYC